MMKSEWGSVAQCGTVWNCVESVEWGVEKFHTEALLRTKTITRLQIGYHYLFNRGVLNRLIFWKCTGVENDSI